MNIPEEIVEQAARALAGDGMYHPWLHRPQARAALSAAAPALMAMAWDEGQQSGYENAYYQQTPPVEPNVNPYRKEQL